MKLEQENERLSKQVTLMTVREKEFRIQIKGLVQENKTL